MVFYVNTNIQKRRCDGHGWKEEDKSRHSSQNRGGYDYKPAKPNEL